VNRTEKDSFINEIREELKEVDKAFLFDYRGLTVEQVNILRREIRNIDSRYRVVKNNLVKLAIKDAPIEPLSEYLIGPTAMAWTENDPVLLAKKILDFAKTNQALEFKAGFVGGRIINSIEFKSLSSLPSKEELLSKLLFLLNYPISGFVTSLNEIMAKFVRILSEVKKIKERN
jgi:large subunit ribosomal protein L10